MRPQALLTFTLEFDTSLHVKCYARKMNLRYIKIDAMNEVKFLIDFSALILEIVVTTWKHDFIERLPLPVDAGAS